MTDKALTLTNRERAIRLRDTALKVVQSKGRLSPLLTGKKIVFKTMIYESGYAEIRYYTPYGPVAEATGVMPYALDVFWPKKVLVIEWNDAGDVRIVGFRRGDWEKKLLALTAV